MIRVPITRFRRELRKWLTKQLTVTITRNGKDIVVLVPAKKGKLDIDKVG